MLIFQNVYSKFHQAKFYLTLNIYFLFAWKWYFGVLFPDFLKYKILIRSEFWRFWWWKEKEDFSRLPRDVSLRHRPLFRACAHRIGSLPSGEKKHIHRLITFLPETTLGKNGCISFFSLTCQNLSLQFVLSVEFFLKIKNNFCDMMETVDHVYVGELNVTGFDPTAVPDKFNSYDVAVVIAYFLLVLATGFYVSTFFFYIS